MHEPPGDDSNSNFMLLRRIEHERTSAQGRNGYPDGLLLGLS